MALLAGWNLALQWNFVSTIFAACTLNFGPHPTLTSQTSPGAACHSIPTWLDRSFSPPPLLIRHLNVPIQAHEHRSSFVQYTAAGLSQWVRNGFKMDEDFELSASKEEQARQDAEHGRRWEEGMKMFSVIDDL
ncbi:hypothetical protein B0H14DRAFT_3521253 [Mycena olivaceomarginata]|nr:hypothetical protein B0H14DRAFT_3521253 [Mycena olivaceomarginata]